ncbi:MAG: methionine synthase [Promethearchaeota archaeon]
MSDDDVAPLVDDVGSFPFPPHVDRRTFAENYFTFYKYLARNEDVSSNRGLQVQFVKPVQYAFRLKLEAGLDVVNYPQLFDMHDMFLRPIREFPVADGRFEVRPEWATIPEVKVLDDVFRTWWEQTGRQVRLKSCVTGPVELYLRLDFGFTVYPDVLIDLARSVNHFLRTSVVASPSVETFAVSIDEPSLGYVDLFNVDDDDLVRALDVATEGLPCDVQVHLHTLSRADLALASDNVRVLTCEYASNPSNILPKEELDRHDKYMRVGICRTRFDDLLAERLDAGQPYEQVVSSPETLIDSDERIAGVLKRAKRLYGDRLRYVGPDCGLSSWGPPSLAKKLLERVARVARSGGNPHRSA